MKNRKSNRLKGYDYSRNNLYFVTNCIKDNLCCFGRVINVGTGRDLSVHNPENNNPENNNPENNNPENNNPENHHPENHHPENNNPENHHPENHHPENNYFVNLNQYGKIVAERITWLEIQYPYVAIHNYVVMPNHFHLILEIDIQKVKGQDIKIKSLSSLIGAMKTTSSKHIHLAGFVDFEWHRSFHDHIIRNELEYNRISNYIDLNPQKWSVDKFYIKD